MTRYNRARKTVTTLFSRSRSSQQQRKCSCPLWLSFIVIAIVMITLAIVNTSTTVIHQPAAIDVSIPSRDTAAIDVSIPSRDILPPLHMLQVGPLRTASSLQFELVCLCHLLQLVHHGQVDQARRLKCFFRDNINDVFGSNGGSKIGNGPMVIKSHKIKQEDYNNNNAKFIDKQNIWVFATATDETQSQEIHNDLSSQLFQVKHVQDLESTMMVKNGSGISGGLEHYIHHYATAIFGLPLEPQTQDIMEFMRYWNILRRCCGAQMSKTWRSQLQERQQIDNRNTSSALPFKDLYDLNIQRNCGVYDIDDVEELFMNTSLFHYISSNFAIAGSRLLRPSQADDSLFGTYCSQYNELVANKKVKFSQNAATRIDRSKRRINK